MTKLHCMKCDKDFDNELDDWKCPHYRKGTLNKPEEIVVKVPKYECTKCVKLERENRILRKRITDHFRFIRDMADTQARMLLDTDEGPTNEYG